jgi:hypothetical protein
VEQQERRTEYPDAVGKRIERARIALTQFSEPREERNDTVEAKAGTFNKFAARPAPPIRPPGPPAPPKPPPRPLRPPKG